MNMSPATIFQIQLMLGYAPWLLLLGAYGLPRLRSMDPVQAQRVIATLHSFRFFGLVFILPGVVAPGLSQAFATSAAYGDFTTGVLAMLALLAVRTRSLFWLLVVAYNVVGVGDLLVNYYNGVRLGLPEQAGQLAAAYWIPILYVPALMITHALSFYLMARSRSPVAHISRLAADRATGQGPRPDAI
jgi:hypothetical protein